MNDVKHHGEHIAMPAAVRHMLRYGIIIGILVGLVGQYVMQEILSDLLVKQSTLDMTDAAQILGGILVVMLLILTVLIIVLGRRWRAPTENARMFSGLGVGFGFALATHSLFVGSTIGAFTNRDSFQLLYRAFGDKEPTFLRIVVDGAFRTMVEGMIFSVAYVLALTIIGGLVGSVLIPRTGKDRNNFILKDASGSMAMIVLPILLYIITIVNIVVFTVVPVTIENIATEIDYRVQTSLIMYLSVWLPFVSVPLVQVFGIIWVHRLRPESVHRMMLRAAQILHVVTMGIALLPVANNLTPGMITTRYILAFHFLIMILAWVFGLFAQWKFIDFKKVRVPKARIALRSLIGGMWTISIIALFLVDLLGVRTVFNTAVYLLRCIEYAPQSYVPIETAVPKIMMYAFWGGVDALKNLMAITLIVVTIITTPVLWFLNLFER